MSFTAQLLRGVRVTLILWLLTVVVITLPMLGLARLVAPGSADGSLLRRGEQVVGARLIGQSFRSPRYLQGRPAGAPNLAASNPELAVRVAEAASGWELAGVSQPAPDLLLDSASALIPTSAWKPPASSSRAWRASVNSAWLSWRACCSRCRRAPGVCKPPSPW